MYFGVFKCFIAQIKTKLGVGLTAVSANYRTSLSSARHSIRLRTGLRRAEKPSDRQGALCIF